MAKSVYQYVAGFVVGDSLRLEREYKTIPVGVTIDKAWLTIKARLKDLDAAALIGPKVITVTQNAHGQIVNETSAITPTITYIGLFFDLSIAETVLLVPDRKYYYDIQLRGSDGALYTPERGDLKMKPQVTMATA
jgi:hypothetical protein